MDKTYFHPVSGLGIIGVIFLILLHAFMVDRRTNLTLYEKYLKHNDKQKH